MSASRLRFVHVGLGPIGLDMIRRSLHYARLEVAGAVDLRADLKGKPLSTLLEGGDLPAHVHVSDDLVGTIRATGAKLVFLTTVSSFEAIVPDLLRCAEAGASVVSSCEELVYPWIKAPDASRRVDAAAKQAGIAILGTGVNPGFVLDSLAVTLTAPVARVERLELCRVVDAATRRGPLQKKVGAGLTPSEFKAKVAAGGFGHRGLVESVHLLAAALGLDARDAEEAIEPVISTKEVGTPFVHVTPGRVAGIHQEASGAEGRIHLDLKMYAGAEKPGDRIQIFGVPDVSVTVEKGYPGDVATSAILLNMAESVALEVKPGLKSMIDMPLPRCRQR